MAEPGWEKEESNRLCEEIRRRQRVAPGPQRIADVLSRLLTRRGYAHVQSAQEWDGLWCELVGSQISAHCRVGKLRRGVLEVLVRNSSVLQELTFRKQELLARLQELAPDAKVKNLRFRVAELD